MENRHQTLCERLNAWKSPYLLPCSFACVARNRTSTTAVNPFELGLVLEELNRKLDFKGTLVSCQKFVTEWPKEPEEVDFASEQDFEIAYETFSETQYDPKPWLVGTADTNVQSELLRAMKWTLNNKVYELKDANGEFVRVAFSSEPNEREIIKAQETQHQSFVEEYAIVAANFFAGDGSVSLYQSNHQLDCCVDFDESVAECYEGCFFDRTIAFTSRSRILMVWIGHLRWYC